MKNQIEKEKEINYKAKIHNMIQTLLNKFKKSSGNESFPFHFKSNPNVFVLEGQIPDIWLKTRKPFNKNLSFLREKEKEKEKENAYPQTPYVIPDESILNSRSLHVDRVEVDDLFGGLKMQKVDLFADEFDLNNPLNSTTSSNHTNNNILQIKKEEKTPSEMNISQDSDLFRVLEEKGLHLNRKWFLVVQSFKSYGPYSTDEMYSFLSYLFKKSPDYKNNKYLLVCDAELDIYYQPESAVDVLKKELTENSSFTSNDKEKEFENFFLNSPISPLNNFTPKNLRQRKLTDPNLITKYDVYEMNSRFKSEHNLPIKNLKDQLKDIRNKENYSQIMNRNNIDSFDDLDINNLKNLFDISLSTPRSIENFHNKNKFNKFNYQVNKNSPLINNLNNLNNSNQPINFKLQTVNDSPQLSKQENLKIKELKSLGVFPNVKLISIKDKLFD